MAEENSHAETILWKQLDALMADAVLIRQMMSASYDIVTTVMLPRPEQVKQAFDICSRLYPGASLQDTSNIKQDISSMGACHIGEAFDAGLVSFQFNDAPNGEKFFERYKCVVKQDFYMDHTQNEDVPEAARALSDDAYWAWLDTAEAEALMPHYIQNRKIYLSAERALNGPRSQQSRRAQ